MQVTTTCQQARGQHNETYNTYIYTYKHAMRSRNQEYMHGNRNSNTNYQVLINVELYAMRTLAPTRTRVAIDKEMNTRTGGGGRGEHYGKTGGAKAGKTLMRRQWRKTVRQWDSVGIEFREN